MTANPYVVSVQQELFAVNLGSAAGNCGISSSPLPLDEVVAIMTRGLNAERRPLAVAPYTPTPSAKHELDAHAAEVTRDGFAIATADPSGAFLYGMHCDGAVFSIGLVRRPADAPGPFSDEQRRQIVENVRALGRRFGLQIPLDPMDEEDGDEAVPIDDAAALMQLLFDA